MTAELDKKDGKEEPVKTTTLLARVYELPHGSGYESRHPNGTDLSPVTPTRNVSGGEEKKEQ